MHPTWILLIAVGIVLVGILVFRLHAFLALLLAAVTVALLTPEETLRSFAEVRVERGDWTPKRAEAFVTTTAPERVAEGFGETARSLGILIAMASIIGKCLLESGAADRIVRSTLRLVGLARAPLAFLTSGFVLGIPVFFDTVFYLMMPLGKALWLRTHQNYVLYVLAIMAGGTMAHSLVPPTPGPLFVASALNVDLLTMIVGGCLIGAVASACGYGFALWANRRWEIPLRDTPDVSRADLEALSQRSESELPPTWLSLLPIMLPIVLIATASVMEAYLDGFASNPDLGPVPAWALHLAPTIEVLGNRNIALMIAAAVAMGLLAWKKRVGSEGVAAAVGTALAGGGVIILITSAGGAFGTMVRQCGVSEEIARMTTHMPALWILPVAFLVTMLIRTAQGSATVAMITAVSVLEHFAEPGILAFHPVYLALAIGCGSKPFAWMADSGFWVICKISGLTEAEGLKTITPMSGVMGFTGLLATMAAATLLPLTS